MLSRWTRIPALTLYFDTTAALLLILVSFVEEGSLLELGTMNMDVTSRLATAAGWIRLRLGWTFLGLVAVKSRVERERGKQ